MSILFWSGGKDAYLALNYYLQTYDDSPTLLTTFDKNSGVVPYQNIPIETIEEQAKQLQLPLKTVGLPPKASNKEYMTCITHVIDEVSKSGNDIGFDNEREIGSESYNRLIFGDWHLEDIRIWREQQFGSIGYSCLFPIWNKPIDELLSFLETLPATVFINNINTLFKPYISTGEKYDRTFVDNLPRHLDPMGENGEFHTLVTF